MDEKINSKYKQERFCIKINLIFTMERCIFRYKEGRQNSEHHAPLEYVADVGETRTMGSNNQ